MAHTWCKTCHDLVRTITRRDGNYDNHFCPDHPTDVIMKTVVKPPSAEEEEEEEAE